MRPNLTVNYGLRYDIEFPPQFTPPDALALAAYNQLGLQKGIQPDTHMFQPRVGLAWNPKGDGKSVVRASYGIFFDHPLLGLYFLGDASDGSQIRATRLSRHRPLLRWCRRSQPLQLERDSDFPGQSHYCAAMRGRPPGIGQPPGI